LKENSAQATSSLIVRGAAGMRITSSSPAQFSAIALRQLLFMPRKIRL